ncbi:MAG: RNA methyltransferase [Xanthomonadales bacterium]|nr:RNA methyltransferase [Xanthomonadales bacterium]
MESAETLAVASGAQRIRIVLVGTQHPGNLGSAARAMRTMGLARMVLVAPEKAPDRDTVAMAAGAEALVLEAPVHATLAEAVADCSLVLGCTARSRRIALEELAPRAGAARLVDAAKAGGEVALVFGLQVLAYTVRETLLAGNRTASGDEDGDPRDQPTTHAELEGFFAQLDNTLEAIDFHKGRAPESALRKLRRIFLRADLSTREVRLLRGVLADAQRMARIASGK